MASSLRLAVAQPISILGDVEHNVAQHVAAVSSARARVVVFPELSLTGYGMEVQSVETSNPVLGPLVEACRSADSVALVGAPTGDANGGRRISMLRVDSTGVAVVYDKMHLGGDEPEHFEPGTAATVLDIDGWRLGLAICKDNGQPEHAAETVALGIDAYVAGVCETEQDRDVQPARAARVISDHGVWVAYASFAGPTGGGFADTAGRSAVCDPGRAVRLQLGRDPGQFGAIALIRQ